MKGVQGREGVRNPPNQHLQQLNKLFFGHTHASLSNRQCQTLNNNHPQKRYFQTQRQANPNHEPIIYHISQNYLQTQPQNIAQYQHQMNPQHNLQIPHGKFNHIDNLNKSVKQIMRSNEQYRDKLLSACQLKAQLQIENAILLKEKQNLDAEIEYLRQELEEKEESVRNMNRYVEKLKQYHLKINNGLKNENICLQSKLQEMQQLKYRLQNIQNQNKLLHEKDAKYQFKISQLSSLNSILEKDNNQLKGDLENTRRNYDGLNRQILNIHENKIVFEQQILKYQGKSVEDDRKIINQSQKIRQLLQKCQNLHKAEQFQRQKRQMSQNLVFQAHRQKQKFDKMIKQLHAQLAFKNQAIQYNNRDLSQLSQVKAQLHNVQLTNNSLSKQLKQKQKKLAIGQEGHSHLLKNLHNLQQENAKLKLELFVQRDSSSHQLSDNVEQYQLRLAQLKEAYNIEIKKNEIQMVKLNEQKNRLEKVIEKKQQVIKEKERIVAMQIEEIVNLQKKINQKEVELDTTKVKMQGVLSEFFNYKSTTQNNISLLQSIQHDSKLQIQQLHSQIQSLKLSNQQLSLKYQSKILLINSLNQKIQSYTQRISSYEQKQISLIDELNNINTLNGLLSATIDSLSQQLKVKSNRIVEQENAIKQKDNQLHQIQFKILQTAQTLQKSQQKGTQLITYIKDKHANIKQIQAKLTSIQNQKKQLQRVNQQYTYYLSQQKLENQRNLQYIDKLVKQNQLTVSKLTTELNYYKKQHQRFKICTAAVKEMKRQLNILQDHCYFLLNDPKISLNRFSAHVNSIHKQTFSRQIQKQRSYINSIIECGKQMKIAVQKLHLSINLLNQQLQFTFSNRNIEK